MSSFPKNRPLKIGINALVLKKINTGGVERVVTGLIQALGRLNDGPEEYLIIGPPEPRESINPSLGSNQRYITRPTSPAQKEKIIESLKGRLGPLRPFLGKLWRPLFLPKLYRKNPEVPRSNGFFESLKLDVIHFPSPHYILSKIPSIYNPHDLQHFHFPEFFKNTKNRDILYPAASRLAHTVVVTSRLVKQDLVNHYHLPGDKIKIIHWGPSTEFYSSPTPKDLGLIRSKYNLPDPFGLYPAMTWEHKNHIRLLEALALLRKQKGIKLELICLGYKQSFWPKIKQRMIELDLSDQVTFLGKVPPEEVRSFYRLARFVIIPTLFEATSGVMREAWLDEVPVACSTATALPEQAGNAALLFNPLSVESIAQAIERINSDYDLRQGLRRNGSIRLKNFSWEKAAKAYRAVYRQAAGVDLSEEDRFLLKLDQSW